MKKFLTLLLFAAAPMASATQCVPRTPKEHFDAADIVFIGKVEALTTKNDARGLPTVTTASMQVERSWKGLRGIRVQIKDWTDFERVGFKVGVRYLVYAEQDGTTNTCMGTTQADSAVDLIKTLGPSIPLK